MTNISKHVFLLGKFSKECVMSQHSSLENWSMRVYQRMFQRKTFQHFIFYWIFELFTSRQVHCTNRKEKCILGSMNYFSLWSHSFYECHQHVKRCLSCWCLKWHKYPHLTRSPNFIKQKNRVKKWSPVPWAQKKPFLCALFAFICQVIHHLLQKISPTMPLSHNFTPFVPQSFTFIVINTQLHQAITLLCLDLGLIPLEVSM